MKPYPPADGRVGLGQDLREKTRMSEIVDHQLPSALFPSMFQWNLTAARRDGGHIHNDVGLPKPGIQQAA